MAEDNNTPTPEESAAAEAEAAQAAADAEAAGGTAHEQALAAVRREAAANRVKLRAVEQERDALKAASQTDAERILTERDALKASNDALTTRVRNLGAQSAAIRNGVHPDLADAIPGLLAWDEIDEDPKSLDRAIKGLLKERPSLAGAVSNGKPRGGSDGGAGGGDGAGSGAFDMNALIRERAGR